MVECDGTVHHFSWSQDVGDNRGPWDFNDDLHSLNWHFDVSSHDDDTTEFSHGRRFRLLVCLPSGNPILIEKLCIWRPDDDDQDGSFRQELHNLVFGRLQPIEPPTLAWKTVFQGSLDGSPDDAKETIPLRIDLSFRKMNVCGKQTQEEANCPCVNRWSLSPPLRQTYASLSADLGKQFYDVYTADVSIEVGDAVIPAHKWILQARLPYFKSMFSSQMLEATTNKIKIDDAEVETVRHMLKFVYCGQLPSNLRSLASRLLPLADKYGIDELKSACKASLKKCLSKENAVETLILADVHGCPELRNLCINKLASWREDMDENEFHPLKQHPDLLIKILTCKCERSPDVAEGEADNTSDAPVPDADESRNTESSDVSEGSSGSDDLSDHSSDDLSDHSSDDLSDGALDDALDDSEWD